MALVKGTNCGFVTEAPTTDPGAATYTTTDGWVYGNKFTSPAGATKVIEIGWWSTQISNEANFEVGIYTHDSDNDKPLNLLPGSSGNKAKGTSAGWKVATGLDITIEPEKIYWIAEQCDPTSTITRLGKTNNAAYRYEYLGVSYTALPGSFGTSDGGYNSIGAIYAVYEVSGTNYIETPSDGFGISDSSSQIVVFNRTISDNITFSDGFITSGNITLNLSDNQTFSDSLSRDAIYNIILSDTITFSDSLSSGFNKLLSDSFLFTDSHIISAGFNKNISDSFTISDNILKVFTKILALSDSFSISDSIFSSLSAQPTFQSKSIKFFIDNQIILKAKPNAFTFLTNNSSIILKRKNDKFTFKLPSRMTIKEA